MQTRILELETELDSKNEKIKDQIEMINTQKKVIALQEAKSQDTKEVDKRKK